MGEFSPDPNHLDRQPLHNFRENLDFAESFDDLYSVFADYLIRQFSVSEHAAMKLYSEHSEQLPDETLFNTDLDMAHEQMKLSLVRVMVPIAENMIDSKTAFMEWLTEAARMAMSLQDGVHTVESCVKAPRGEHELECEVSTNCPVKVVKHALIVDCMKPDFESLDYTEPSWTSKKIEKTLAKLTVAEVLGLTEGFEFAATHSNYLQRCAAHGVYIPQNGDI